MSDLPTWLECRPDRAGYARVRFHLQALSFDQAPHLSALAGHILDLGLHSVLLDLEGVEYLSSDALGALMHLSRRLREVGGLVVVANAGPIVRMVFTPFPEHQRLEPNRVSAFLFLDEVPVG
jgi:hypothetical protein